MSTVTVRFSDLFWDDEDNSNLPSEVSLSFEVSEDDNMDDTDVEVMGLKELETRYLCGVQDYHMELDDPDNVVLG